MCSSLISTENKEQSIQPFTRSTTSISNSIRIVVSCCLIMLGLLISIKIWNQKRAHNRFDENSISLME